jgi:simple sugar transport system permease protein
MLHMPTVVHLPLTLLAGIAGGMVCGAVPGLLRAYTGAHEVIVTLMFNYVTYAFLLFAVLSTPFQQPGQSNDIGRTMDPTAILAPLFGAKSGLRVSYGIFVAAAVVVFAWWLLDRSSLGFDFRVTGANPSAARASGINGRRVVVVVFLISGGLAGLAGLVQVASTTHYIDGGFLIGNAGIGFTAITVALLGRNRPVGIVWASLLFAALGVGGRNMQATTGIPLDLATVIQSAIVLFVATPVMVKEIFHLKRAPTLGLQLASTGWASRQRPGESGEHDGDPSHPRDRGVDGAGGRVHRVRVRPRQSRPVQRLVHLHAHQLDQRPVARGNPHGLAALD